MPRRLVVSRTFSVVDYDFTAYERSTRYVFSDTMRFADKGWSTSKAMKEIEKRLPDVVVTSIDRIDAKKVTYEIGADDFMRVAKEK